MSGVEFVYYGSGRKDISKVRKARGKETTRKTDT
jgi:hypothetical protein